MPTGDGKGRRILVVDDEADIVNLLVEILMREGHHADTAPNGAAALSLVEGREYDLILCDLRMPVLDGPGFYRELQRRRPELLRRLVFITGDALSASMAAFLAEAARPRLPTPFSVPELRASGARALAALNVGATRQEVAEVIFQQVTYGGMPVVVEALRVFKEVLEERGEWE